jgi:hypothetical protein
LPKVIIPGVGEEGGSDRCRNASKCRRHGQRVLLGKFGHGATRTHLDSSRQEAR